MPTRHKLRRRGRQTPLVVALYLNAGLIACLLTAVLSRNNSSAAYAAPMEPGTPQIAGGNGVFLMPGQFAINVWGCYVLDTARQTLVAYEYTPNQKQLRLVASRFIGHDRELMDFNTTPSPAEIARLVNLQNNPVRGQPGVAPAPEVPIGPANAPTTKPNDPIRPPGERPLDRPPQEGDADFVPKASDINKPDK